MKRTICLLVTTLFFVLPGRSEAADETANPLAALAWMIGSWSHDSEGVIAKMSARWVDGGRFMERSFEIKGGSARPMNIRQTIFWDPAGKRIRSWGFTSDGGFEEGEWEIKDGVINVQREITYHDGSRGKAINTWRQVNAKRCTVGSTKRSVNRRKIPDMAPTELDRVK